MKDFGVDTALVERIVTQSKAAAGPEATLRELINCSYLQPTALDLERDGTRAERRRRKRKVPDLASVEQRAGLRAPASHIA